MKRRGGLSEKSISSLLNKVQKIRQNFVKNQINVQTQFKPMFDKSIHFDRTIYKEDRDIFDIAYETTMIQVKHIRTNRQVQERFKDFVKTYKLGLYTMRGLKVHVAIQSRDEFVNNFKDLGMDNSTFEYLRKNHLWNSSNFWQSFFNSSYFIPLYRKYNKGDESTFATSWRTDKSKYHGRSFWGDEILSFAMEYLGDKSRVAYDFKYTKENKD